MASAPRASTLTPARLALGLGLAVVAWLGLSAFHAAGFQQPWGGPGTALLAALLAAASWSLVEEPRLAPGGAGVLGRAFAGLLLLVLGQALIYPEMGGKDAAAALGFGLMLGGVALASPYPAGRRPALALAAALAAVGLLHWMQRQAIAWDLFQGPFRGQISVTLSWGLLAAGLGALAWQGSRLRLSAASAPLSRRQEAWGLAAVLLVGAGLRFWRPAALPQGYWYDEVNLARAIQESVLINGRVPLYLTDQVENPGAWLWLGAAVFKAFGVSIEALRLASGAFGLLAVLPFWALARLWLGPRWALVAALVFACMRWTLIPQRIAFMSGFALFWMLAAFWGLWWAWLRGGPWRWLAAGLLLGANLHTYTPARFVPLIAGAFLLLQGLTPLRRQGPPLRLRHMGLLALGFLLSAGPMLWYIATHWAEYTLRAKQVSLFADVAKSGRPLAAELWGTFTKHLLMFNYRGDFNARHNVHFLPHVDLLTACAFALSLPLLLGQALRDARARFLLLWAGAMLAAGIFTLPVEAPQGHRTVLAAPALALGLGLALPSFLAPLRTAFGGLWPQSLKALGAVLLGGLVFLNGWELLREWPQSAATFRSFSPRSSAVLRAIRATQPGTLVYTSELPNEYQFHGFEWGVFSRFALRQQGRLWGSLRPGMPVPGQADGGATRSVLLIWGESDAAVTEALQAAFPGLPIHREPQPHPAAGEPSLLYLAAEIPYERLPARPAGGALPFIFRAEP